MLDYTRTRGEDVRALTRSIGLGSGAGLIIGVVCLAGSGGHASSAQPAAAPQPSPAAPLISALAPSRTPGRPVIAPPAIPASVGGQASQTQALRDRIRLAALERRRPAKPFQAESASGSDLHCLAEAVYFEARGEEQPGQQAVAQVVLNRVRHPAFPKTICGVVHQRTASGCQFSFACGVQAAQTGGVAWRRAETVAAAEMHGAVMGAVGDATHFQTARAGAFAGLLKVAQVGAHVFYRFAGHAGAPGMFHQAPAPSDGAAGIRLAQLEPTAASARPMADAVKPSPASAAPAAGLTPSKPAAEAAKPASTPVGDPKAAGEPSGPGAAAAPPSMPATAKEPASSTTAIPVTPLARS